MSVAQTSSPVDATVVGLVLAAGRPAGPVSDVAKVLDTASVRRMTGVLDSLERATRAQIVVVTLPGLGQFTAKQVAEDIGNRWGVGPTTAPNHPMHESGAVLLLVPSARQYRLALGNGAARFIPQQTVDSVLALMRPDFAAGRYGEGLERGVRALVALYLARARTGAARDSLPSHAARAPRGAVLVARHPIRFAGSDTPAAYRRHDVAREVWSTP